MNNKIKIANFADDNTIYTVENDIMELLKILESETFSVLNWFRMNEMKSNQGKCHLLVADKDHKSYSYIYLDNAFLENESVKLLGVTIDQNLDFEEHITLLLNEGNKKLHALLRIAKYLTQDKLRLIMKTFIESQLNYCPLIWMCHSRGLNQRINKLHERALTVVYKNSKLTFEQLLEKDESFTTHERNLQKLTIEMYKVKRNLCPKLFQELFTPAIHGSNDRVIPEARTVSKGVKTIRYRGLKTWEIVSEETKKSKSLSTFKENI